MNTRTLLASVAAPLALMIFLGVLSIVFAVNVADVNASTVQEVENRSTSTEMSGAD